MKNLRTIRNNTLVGKLLLLDGYSRAGKFLLGKILDGFQGIEHFQHVSLLEQLPYLARLGVVSENVAVSMMRVCVDENSYHMRIGRNLNFRNDDSSSLLKAINVGEYIERAFTKKSSDVVREFQKGKHCPVFVAHEALSNIKIYFKAFPFLNTISLQRHPVDLIYSWWQRGWGERETTDPLCFHPSFQIKNNVVPWYACRWPEDYKKLPRMDRVIMIMKALDEMNRKSYRALTAKERKSILFISHEDLIENSWEVISKIKKFMNISPGDFMPQILVREKCLRPLLPGERTRKIEAIRKASSKKMFGEMMKLALRYESCAEKKTPEILYLS